jgi:hypothetical protein
MAIKIDILVVEFNKCPDSLVEEAVECRSTGVIVVVQLSPMGEQRSHSIMTFVFLYRDLQRCPIIDYI